jgi:hypothetical protein
MYNIHNSNALLLTDIFSFHKSMFYEQWNINLSQHELQWPLKHTYLIGLSGKVMNFNSSFFYWLRTYGLHIASLNITIFVLPALQATVSIWITRSGLWFCCFPHTFHERLCML